MNMKTKLRIICVLCDVFSGISLLISLIYTIKFFTTGTNGFQMFLMIMLSVVFEAVKIIIVASDEKRSLIKTIIMFVFILISISFTMNDFLNEIDRNKQASKQINPEYTKQQDLIKKSDKNIENIEKEIKTLNQQKENRLKNLVPEDFKITKTSTAKHYDDKKTEIDKTYNEKIENAKKELKVEQINNKKIMNEKIDRYIFNDGNAGNINTKILDFVFGDNLDQKTKNLLISLFIAVLIDFTHLTLTFVKNKENEKLDLIINKEKEEKTRKEKEMKKQSIIENSKQQTKKQVKKAVGENEIKNEDSNVVNFKKVNKVNIEKNKKEIIKKMTVEAEKIIELTIENNGIVPKYRELAEKFNCSTSVIQRRVRELIDNSIVCKVEGKKTLELCNMEMLKNEARN